MTKKTFKKSGSTSSIVASVILVGSLLVALYIGWATLIKESHNEPQPVLENTDESKESYNEPQLILEDTFNDNESGWSGGFSDYPVDYDKSSYQLEFSRKRTPSEIGQQKALFLSGTNGSADLFMFIKKKIDSSYNLKPNTDYLLDFNFDIATNTPAGLVGIGSAPGEGVTVKAGATTGEPDVINQNGYLQMNIDKGNQSTVGKDMIVLDDLANTKDTDDYSYELKNFKNQDTFKVRTNEHGEVWLVIGTDSGFEGRTSIYISSVKVILTEN
ncbi:hypothetical protein [Jeotgalibacillus marinus]|uniref:Uncharacterized protein n=1 Tax=Jeotgalibacillus marinus TaxID=86667 RepID=A0ABV3Q0K1_9BACL